uniref:C2H2-type domain-containing protein n=2 Tax=Echeneis naucrates TaxID=173247 RepID=A0A665TZV5_ECHNA
MYRSSFRSLFLKYTDSVSVPQTIRPSDLVPVPQPLSLSDLQILSPSDPVPVPVPQPLSPSASQTLRPSPSLIPSDPQTQSGSCLSPPGQQRSLLAPSLRSPLSEQRSKRNSVCLFTSAASLCSLEAQMAQKRREMCAVQLLRVSVHERISAAAEDFLLQLEKRPEPAPVPALRALLTERLTAAAEEIVGLLEETVAEYEDRAERSEREICRQRKLLDAVLKPEVRLHRAEVQQLFVTKEDQDPNPPHIKEEEDEVWTNHEEDQIQGLEEAEVTTFTFSPVTVKTEDEDDEEELQFSQAHQGQTETRDSEGRPVPQGDSGQVLGHKASKLFVAEIEVSCEDWEETSEPEKQLQCPKCGKIFATAAILGVHMKTHTGEKLFHCTFCGRSVGPSGNLTDQMHAPLEEKRFLYCACGKRFAWRDGSKSSQLHRTLDGGMKLFGCSVCMKFFSSSSSIRKHLRIHTGEKPFDCSVCGKRFTEKGNLVSHMACHTGEKRFSCNGCNRKFIWRSVFKKHKCVKDTQESVAETRTKGEDCAGSGIRTDLGHSEPGPEFQDYVPR